MEVVDNDGGDGSHYLDLVPNSESAFPARVLNPVDGLPQPTLVKVAVGISRLIHSAVCDVDAGTDFERRCPFLYIMLNACIQCHQCTVDLMGIMLSPLAPSGHGDSHPAAMQFELLRHLRHINRDTSVGGWHSIAFTQWRPWDTWCTTVFILSPHPTHPPHRKLRPLLVRKLRPLPAVRIGEASHPGPTVLVANVTSMASAWCDLVALKWDVAMIQEARVGPDHRVMSEAREARIGVFLGPLDHDGVALVAFLVRQGHATKNAECQHMRCTGLLWQHFGCTPIRLYNMYGDATGSLDGKLETGALRGRGRA